MLRQKNKLQVMEPSQNDKVKDIYQMFSMEQKRMTELLHKYQTNPNTNISPITVNHHTIQVSNDLDQKQKKKKTLNTEIKHAPIELPKVSRASVPLRNNKSRKGSSISRVHSKTYDPYRQQLQPNQKNRVSTSFEKAYMAQKTLKINSKSPPVRKATTKKSQTPNDDIRNETERILEKANQGEEEQDLPMPMGYFGRKQEQDEASSEEGEVPLSYYERAYFNMMKDQCLEQTNFLFFSKNESIKDWTEGLLLLFQKHDKQLLGLKKRCKYLEKFDENFFAVDIFRDD